MAGSLVADLFSFDLSLAEDTLFSGRKRESGRIVVAGFDEAGRGALAGPVAVGCVSFDLERVENLAAELPFLDDSKRVTPKRREVLFERIKGIARFGVGFSSAAEIDRLGIVRAARLAASRAYARIAQPVDLALLDRGLSLGGDGPIEVVLTRGDSRSFHIAAASIIAKVARDRLMRSLDSRFPGYSLSRHKGYGTASHLDAIGRLGPSRIHRLTFIHPR